MRRLGGHVAATAYPAPALGNTYKPDFSFQVNRPRKKILSNAQCPPENAGISYHAGVFSSPVAFQVGLAPANYVACRRIPETDPLSQLSGRIFDRLVLRS